MQAIKLYKISGKELNLESLGQEIPTLFVGNAILFPMSFWNRIKIM